MCMLLAALELEDEEDEDAVCLLHAVLELEDDAEGEVEKVCLLNHPAVTVMLTPAGLVWKFILTSLGSTSAIPSLRSNEMEFSLFWILLRFTTIVASPCICMIVM